MDLDGDFDIVAASGQVVLWLEANFMGTFLDPNRTTTEFVAD